MLHLPHNLQLIPINLVLSTITFYIAARIYILPQISTSDPKKYLIPILLLNSFRHIGLLFISAGATYPGMPPLFSFPDAAGDMVATALAFTAMPLVMTGRPEARYVLWALTIEGTIDFVMDISLAVYTNAPLHMGPTYWIPTLFVPAMLISHYVTFKILTQQKSLFVS